MKKQITLFTITLFTLVFMSSCDKLKSLADVEFDANFESQMDVPIQPTSLKTLPGTFNTSVTIDPLSNADFLKYKEKIKDISIIGATIEITELTPTPITINGTLTASDTQNPPNLSASWPINNEVLTVGKKITLSTSQFVTLQQIFNLKTPFTVTFAGQSSASQGTIKVKVTYKTKVKANPL